MCQYFLTQNFLMKINLKTWWKVFLNTQSFSEITMFFQQSFVTMIQ